MDTSSSSRATTTTTSPRYSIPRASSTPSRQTSSFSFRPVSAASTRVPLTDSRELATRGSCYRLPQDILDLARAAHERSGAEIIVANFLPAPTLILAPFASVHSARTGAFASSSTWNLASTRPPIVHICDAEFLATRRGSPTATTTRGWFETKQLYSSDFAVDIAREVGSIVASLHKSVEESARARSRQHALGRRHRRRRPGRHRDRRTSPRGEAFKAVSARHRVARASAASCSPSAARTTTRTLPSRLRSIPRWSCASRTSSPSRPTGSRSPTTCAGWPQELNLGLDCFVFVDDNPAEIEIVHQFVPEIDDDPARPRSLGIRRAAARLPAASSRAPSPPTTSSAASSTSRRPRAPGA